MAHIEKRQRRSGIVWRARYRGPDGSERSRTFARKSDAEAFLTKVEDSKLRGEWVDPSLGKTRVRDYAEQWLTTKADVAPRTFVNIEARLRMHVEPHFGSMALNRVRPSDVRAFVAELVRAGYAPGTVKATYQIVAQIFAQAALDGLVARSPCVGIELPRDRRREEMRFLEPEQVNRLAEAIDHRYRALAYTAAYGGLRAGELGALTVRRLDLLGRTLHVAESAGEVRGRLVFGPTKTGKVRTISLPPFLADMLGEHLGRYPSTAGWVFTAAEGGPVRHRNFYARHFRPAVACAGLPDGLRFHDLRHTCAAFLIAEGRHIEEVKDYLGHSSIRVTSDRYGHLFPKARRELAQALDARFRGTARKTPAAQPRPSALVLPFPDTNSGPEGPLTREAIGADDGTRTRDPHLGKVMPVPLETAGTAGVKVSDAGLPLETAGTARDRCVGVASGVAAVEFDGLEVSTESGSAGPCPLRLAECRRGAMNPGTHGPWEGFTVGKLFAVTRRTYSRRASVVRVMPIMRTISRRGEQCAGGKALLEQLIQCLIEGTSCSFRVLVSATPVHEHLVWIQGEAQAVARRRPDAALAGFGDQGALVAGEVGDADAPEAVADGQGRGRFDRISQSTLPGERARWIRQGLSRRFALRTGRPVCHTVASPERVPRK